MRQAFRAQLLAQRVAHVRLMFDQRCVSGCAQLRERDEYFHPIARRDHCTLEQNGSSSVDGGMYDVDDTANARCTASGCVQKNMPALIGTESHLCASHVTESASAMPSSSGRNRATAERCRPRRVDVKPRAVRARNACELGQRIDRARRGRAGCADDHQRRESVANVLRDALLELSTRMHSESSDSIWRSASVPRPVMRAIFTNE